MASITYEATDLQTEAVQWKAGEVSAKEGRPITAVQYFTFRTDHWVNAVVREYEEAHPPETRDVLWDRATTEDKAAIDAILEKYRTP